jgi:hypothetical protein
MPETDVGIRVEVAVAWPELQVLVPLLLQRGATVGDAVEAAGLQARFPALEIRADRLGVFSTPCGPERVLGDGDRVEIYRPLKIDPKIARRLIAEAGASRSAQPPSGS